MGSTKHHVSDRHGPGICCALAVVAASGIGAQRTFATEIDTAADDSAEVRLQEVIVTARKREESARNVPATIDVLGGEQLSALAVSDLFEVAAVVPGMVFSRAPDDGLGLTFRGLGTPARTQSFDQSIALFVDGTFIGKGRMYSSAFFDVERTELIKGTQSTLLGKNTSLGAISLISRKPGSGSYISTAYEFVDGGPTVDAAVDLGDSDEARFRVAGHYLDTQGWVKNITTGNTGPHDVDLDLRGIAMLRPLDSVKVTLSYQFSNDRRIGNGYEFIDPNHVLPASFGPGVLGDAKASYTSEGDHGESFHQTRSHLLNSTIDFALGDSVLTSVTAYAKYDLNFVDDFDFGPKDATYFLREEDYHQVSQELRLTSPDTGHLSYLVGLFYFHSNWRSSETQIYNTPLAIPPGTIFLGGFANDFTQKTQTVSAFGSTTYRFSDAWRINTGLRFTHETKDATWGRPAIAPLTFWNQVVNPPFPTTPLSFVDNFINGNVSLQRDFGSNITAYIGYGRGTKTGGFAESAQVSSGNPGLPSDGGGAAVKSETADSGELGLKSSLLNQRLLLSAAGFVTRVKNFQNTTFTGSSFDTSNVDVRSYGLETELAWQMTRAWRLETAWTYAHARIISPVESLLAEAPEWTGHAGLHFEHAIPGSAWTLNASTQYRYRGSMVHQKVLSFRSEPYRPVDVTVGVRSPDERFTLELIGRNVNDSLSADFSGPPADPTLGPGVRADAPSPLRTVTLQARYVF